MSLSETPRANRVHIGFFGKRNVGKSSLINALTGQEIAIVSDVLGTTTDPVFKSMEILPIGPCVIIDTAGLDDDSDLGKLRIEKTYEVLNKTDVAVFVKDGHDKLDKTEKEILRKIKEKKIPVIAVLNKADIHGTTDENVANFLKENKIKVCSVSAKSGNGIKELKLMLSKSAPDDGNNQSIFQGIISKGDLILLITPIDSSAPKGRLILPQQQVIREVLENHGICIVVQEDEVENVLDKLKDKPALAITDSQVFAKVAKVLPKDIHLTSFSILFARLKGDLNKLIEGTEAIKNLQDGDKVLVAEACTHHAQCDDIGRVKIPNMLKKLTGKQLVFEHSSGFGFKKDLSQYKVIIHCGACMLNRKEMMYRLELADGANIPVVNYGVLLAYMTGILQRATAPLLEDN